MKQKLRVEQRQELTPRLIELLKILQMPRMELQQMIRHEIELNPFLEDIDDLDEEIEETEEPDNDPDLPHEDDFDYDYFYHEEWKQAGYDFTRKSKQDEEFNAVDIYSAPQSFRDHMYTQVHLTFDLVDDIEIGEYITDSLSDEGLLEAELADISEQLKKPEFKVEAVHKRYKLLNPIGVGSRTIQECLLTQLEFSGRRESLAYIIIEQFYDDFISNRLYKILAKLNIDENTLKEGTDEICKLNPKPANGEWGKSSQYIVPDVVIERKGDDYVPMLNTMNFPELHLNKRYMELLERRKDLNKNERTFLKKKLNAAVFMVSGIHRRHQTLMRISERIVQLQKDFLTFGVSALKPMTLSDISEYIEVHESTVSRAIENKHIDTPIGLFPFKFFFTRGIRTPDGDTSTLNVKDIINNIVNEEDKNKPLRDNEIADILKEKHQIEIARRTVAKYREQTGILPANKRKKYFKED